MLYPNLLFEIKSQFNYVYKHRNIMKNKYIYIYYLTIILNKKYYRNSSYFYILRYR